MDKEGPAPGPGAQEPPPESTLRGPGGGVVYEDVPYETQAVEDHTDKLIAKLRREIEHLEWCRNADKTAMASYLEKIRKLEGEIEFLKTRVDGLLDANTASMEERRKLERKLAYGAKAAGELESALGCNAPS